MTSVVNKRILLVEDEEINRKIVQNDLKRKNYEVISAENGQQAMDILKDDRDFSVIVLDRMMPVMDGIEVTKRLQNDEELKNIPIVMQTAAASSQQIKEGIKAGVFYYLTKPFSRDVLISIIETAIRESVNKQHLVSEVCRVNRLMGLMDESKFRFRTLEESQNLSYLIANACPEPKTTVWGISELMVNAIEHGNLGITYEEKKQYILEHSWYEEVQRRLSLDKNTDRYASISFSRNEREIKLTIKDCGQGFDWKKYMNLSPKRVTDPNGRGIFIARTTSFDKMEYNEIGNEVYCYISL